MMQYTSTQSCVIILSTIMWIACVYVHTDSYGGTLAGEDEASYLFSNDATAKDTIRQVLHDMLLNFYNPV